MSRDEKVKLIVEIIEDALALEYELYSCKNKKRHRKCETRWFGDNMGENKPGL